MHAVLSWWDGVELWLAGLSFTLQFIVTMVVVLPLCAGAAFVVDRVIDHVLAIWETRTGRSAEDQREE